MPHELWLLLPIAFTAGLIDAAVGGGGLIQLPGLLTVLPRELPAVLMGSNKLASIMGTSSATWRYARRIELPWGMVFPAAATAFAGAYLGARTVHFLPVSLVQPLVIILLICMLGYTWFRPDFGQADSARPLSRRDLLVGMLLGTLIGFYDGFFGPGTGSFLIFLFVRLFHFDFLRASACAKVVNLATNLAALVFFIPAGAVLYTVAIPMGLANIAGAQLGTKLALQGGNLWLRRLFLGLALTLLLRLLWTSFA
jgi:uncharacterized membrane protein YfcA